MKYAVIDLEFCKGPKHRGNKPKYEKSYRQNIRDSIDKAVAEKVF